MYSAGTFGIGPTQGNYPLRIAPLRAPKPRDDNRFDGEYEKDPRLDAGAPEIASAGISSRFETAHSRFWNGPRLNPAFAAQVLGQILTKNEYSPRSTVAVYGDYARRFAPSLDLTA